MRENFYRTGNYNVDHSTFGGIINSSDFNRKTTISEIADKIIRDKRKDEKLKRMAKRRDENVK